MPRPIVVNDSQRRAQRRLAPKPTDADDFDRAVERAVRSIPRGHISSYGQIAARAGKPSRARAVAKALQRIQGVPWWRVVRSDGTIAAEMMPEQARRLRREKVTVVGRRVAASRPDALPSKSAHAKRRRAKLEGP